MDSVLVAVIGGSGLYHLDNLTFVKHVNPLTPWGYPSAPITISRLPSGALVAFLTRHGPGHTISPSAIPFQANIAALKSLGVRALLAFSAVGSLREEIPPGAFSLPTQIIDRTKGIRPSSFFDPASSVVAHAAFGEPFSLALVPWLEERVKHALTEHAPDVKLFSGQCIVCMEGPQFSTRAESIMYRQWGADLINMSVIPEAKLAREAEISYALIAMATDYDSWRPHSAAVTVTDVLKTLQANADNARLIAASVLEDLVAAVACTGEGVHPNGILASEVGSMRFAIMPRSKAQKDEDRKKLAYILPEYFADEEGAQAEKN